MVSGCFQSALSGRQLRDFRLFKAFSFKWLRKALLRALPIIYFLIEIYHRARIGLRRPNVS
jgi:hypothetical protein